MRPLIFGGASTSEGEDTAMMAAGAGLIHMLEGLDVEPDEDHPIEVLSAHLDDSGVDGLMRLRAELLAGDIPSDVIETNIVLARAMGASIIVVAYLPEMPYVEPPDSEAMN